MKVEKHTQLCEHIADRLNDNPNWVWECNGNRTMSMEAIETKIETLNWKFWTGKEVAQIIRAMDVMPEQTIEDLIQAYSQELADYACGVTRNVLFTFKF